MARSERLQTVAGIAKDREDRAALSLAELRRQQGELETRLEELRRFQGEYQQRMETLGRDGIAIQQLNQYRRFNERLGEAVRQQQCAVDEMRRHIEQQTRSWSEASAKRHALDETVSRLRAEEAVHAGRKEQRETDDRAQRPRPARE